MSQERDKTVSDSAGDKHLEITTDEGKSYVIDLSGFRMPSGELAWVAIASDITSHKTAEKEMARLDRLKLVGQMAAGLGHEIRNPITTVRGFLQLLGGKPQNEVQRPTFDLMIWMRAVVFHRRVLINLERHFIPLRRVEPD